MNLQAESDRIDPHYAECLRLNKCWGWFLVLGIVLMVVGALAIGAAFITTIASVMLFGFLLLAGGIVQIVNAFLGRGWRAFFLNMLIGLLHFVVGGIMIEHPLRAAEGVTLMIAAAFLLGGLARMVYAMFETFSGWGWVLLNGFITFLLGMSIWRQWPESSVWVIGLFIGIDLLFSGWSWVMLAILVKAAPKADGEMQAPSHGVSA